MPPAEWTRIIADSIDEAAGRVIELLEDTSEGNVMYFHGWCGLGASAVLRAVAKRLTMRPSPSPGRRRWEKMIHVDCSVWQSKRALQKAIAQELQLPWSLMALFDQHDEEDDFSGVEQSARGVIQDVSQAILSILASRTFLVIFHNGSNGYIDLLECGVPVITGILNKTVLWTSRSSFRITDLYIDNVSKEDRDKLAGLSDVAIYADPTADNEDAVKFIGMLLHEEAEEVARYTGVPQSAGMSTELVKMCIMYQLMLRQQHVDYTQHWDTHADTTSSTCCHSSSPWEIAQALYNNLILEFLTMDNYDSNPIFAEEILRDLRLPSDFVDESSFFWTCDAAGNNNVDATTACYRQKSLEAKMFQHPSARSLRVIHLFDCTFSFASPPFLSCSSLRFLLLDHCKDKHNLGSAPNSTSAGDTDKETGISSGACFQKLWVLDLSYTDWYWLLSVEAQDLMVELRELNVKGVKHWSINHLLRDGNNSSAGVGSSTKPLGLLNLVKLQVTTEPITEDQHQSQVWKEDQVAATLFPNLSSCKIVKTIILDGCFELTRIDPHDLPPSLESFSFSSSSNDNDVDVTANIESISFRGCTQLKSVLLRGVFERLKQLDVSGTCIKTLDLRAMRGNGSLKELFLLGCKELRAILWPTQDVSLEVLHIDTSSTELDHATGVVESSSFSPVEFKWYISVRDRRLLRSLNDTKYPLDAPCIEISSPPASVATATTDGSELGGTISKRRPIAISRAEQRWLMSTKSRRPAADNKKLYADVDSTIQHLQLQATMNGNWMWPYKQEGSTSHYISLQDDKRMQTKPLSSPSLPGSICERASGLHDVFRVYDNNQELLVATKEFSELKHIHLHELPSLQRICGHRIVAPKLETIKIRGCWSLTRLPAVGLDSTRKPKVDCEKEWWDGLQWDGLEKGHHPSLYELTHSRYYKKKLPRGSMLR
ncbi:hypothetical protein OsJ_02092 [Oryza sativa Japonica Group]|uniref:NB-ARC domain-containing protein n=1 Tax=Oryza sativa subsp. japonica TaxID=39947 RepID=A2ZU10_ORYSJ|nr:hypothetical protein OsJ_02092 [Oryza sativa Japonica Group]